MASKELMVTTSRPRLHVVKDLTGENAVRAYRMSPGEVNVQIRMVRKYADVALTLTEAKEFARLILAAADDTDAPAHGQGYDRRDEP